MYFSNSLSKLVSKGGLPLRLVLQKLMRRRKPWSSTE